MTDRVAVSCFLFALLAMPDPPGLFAQARPDDHNDSGPLQTGYVVVTPLFETAGKFVVFETFGLKRGDEILQAAVLPTAPTTRATFFVNVSEDLGRNSGLALANPQAGDALISLTLRRDDGIVLGIKEFLLRARGQTSRFLTEFLEGVPNIPKEFSGTLLLQSDVPVSAIGLRFRGQTFSTLPPAEPAATGGIPQILPDVGGPGAVLLPHFVAGAGWETEILIMNTTDSFLAVRVDLFRQDGTPFTVRLNGTSGATFINQTIQPRAVFILSPRDSNGKSRF